MLSPDSAAASVPTIRLRDVSFSALTENDVVSSIIDALARGDGGWVSTPNTQQLRLIGRDQGLHDLVSDASIVVADGMPLIWAAALQGDPLPERVPGSSLVWSLAGRARDAGASIFLLGGDTGVATRAGARLADQLPGIRIAGCHYPPPGFEDSPSDLEHIQRRVCESAPDIVYVGLGFPKQERLIISLRELLPHAWFLGIGMSLSFISEDHSRAPRWMQRVGLEWLHRLAFEPTRLFRRYVIEGIPFATAMLAGSARIRAVRIVSTALSS